MAYSSLTQWETARQGWEIEGKAMYDEYGNFYEDEIPVSSIASGFGFDSDDEFNDYCDEMDLAASDD